MFVSKHKDVNKLQSLIKDITIQNLERSNNKGMSWKNIYYGKHIVIK